MISNNLSQDVKNKLGITGKSELENLKFAKELTFEQNDRIAQTYNIEYSHNNKNPEYFNIYMTDKYDNLVYTNSMSSEVVLKVEDDEESTFSVLNKNKELYSYDNLISKKDLSIKEYDLPDNINKDTNKREIVRQAKQNATKNANGKYTSNGLTIKNKDLGINIILGSSGINHSLNKRRNNYNMNLIASTNIGTLLQNAIAINELDSRDSNNKNGSIVFANIFKNNNDICVVRIIVDENKNIDRFDTFNLYAVNTKKGVNSALQADTPSNISLSDFLDYSKNFLMISNNLSQDVKNKLGITGKSELENLKFAKELTFEQNDRIAQTYNIEYSHNNKKRN